MAGLFELADGGRQHLKGFTEPIQAWRVSGPKLAESRFEARHRAGATPLVGRDGELGCLLRRWQQAKNGEGQIVLLCGEAGIGKSRLVASFREQLGSKSYVRVSCHCSPHHQDTALYPVTTHLARAAGLIAGESTEQQLGKLERLLSLATGSVEQVVPLFAELLSIATDDRYPLPSMSAQRRRERMLEALAAQITGLSRQRPVLIVFEDVHWIDITSLELLALLTDNVPALRAMLILTFRPEFAPPWAGHAHVTSLSINRLSRKQSGVLVEQVAGDKRLPAPILDQILAKTDGVPLFAEELTKTVLESGLLRDEGSRYSLVDLLPPLAIPATLRASLTARLDRLAPVKEVAQTAAAVGREFSYRLLAAAIKMRDETLSGALEQLVEAGLIFRRGVPPDATYTFKHALIQDAAYETLLRSKRQQIHLRIAAALQERFPEEAETEPEILAHHFTQAGVVEAAVDHWLKAGQIAAGRSACKEAIAQLSRGLDLLKQLPDNLDRCRRELDLQVALGGALAVAQGQAAASMGRAFARARELCDSLPERPLLMPVLYGQYVHHSSRGEMYRSLAITEALLQEAKRRDSRADLSLGHRAFGTTLLLSGRLGDARAHLEQALAFGGPGEEQRLTQAYIFAPYAVTLAYLAMSLLVLGYFEQARARIAEALIEARRLAHPITSAVVLGRACIIHRYVNGCRMFEEAAEALCSIAAEQGFVNWHGHADVELGWATVAAGQIDAGLARMRKGLAAVHTVEQQFDLPRYLGLFADVHRLAGQAADGLKILEDALDRANGTGERWFEAELHRLKGEVIQVASPDAHGQAAACFRRAVEVAQGQGARLWELRATVSLARLLREHGSAAEARDLLSPTYAWFTEGFDTPDLTAARALLDEFRGLP